MSNAFDLAIKEATRIALTSIGPVPTVARWACYDARKLHSTVIGDVSSAMRSNGFGEPGDAVARAATLELVRVIGQALHEYTRRP